VLRTITLPFRRLPPTTRFLVGFFTVAILTTLLLARTHSALTSAEVYQEGDVVRADVTAPADITAEDARQTEMRRAAARTNTPPVWDYDPARIESAVQSFRTAWMMLRQQAEVRASANTNAANANSQRELAWPGQAPDRQAVARAVAAHNFDAGALEMLTHVMRDAGGGYVYDERDAPELREEVRVADVRAGGAEV
jgi:membrane-associated HD superfamily phosphohydrolase